MILSVEFKVKKEGWGGGGTRQIKYVQAGYGDKEILTIHGKVLTIAIGPGLPSTSSKYMFIVYIYIIIFYYKSSIDTFYY